MESTRTVTHYSKGGGVWLLAIAAIAALWGSALGLWPTLLLSWTVVSSAFAWVRMRQRYIGKHAAVSVTVLSVWTAIVAWIVGFGIERFATDAIIYSDDETTNTILMAILITLTAAAWIISCAFVRAAAHSGDLPSRIVAAAWRMIKSDSRAWLLALTVTMLLPVMISFASSRSPWLEVVCGIIAALLQIRMLAIVNSAPSSRTKDAQVATLAIRMRKIHVIAIIALNVIYIAFGILIVTTGGMDTFTLSLIDYPFGLLIGWGFGALACVIAWLVGLSRPAVIATLLVLIVLNVIGSLVVILQGPDYFFQ